jgi:hypothetical protein
MTSLSLVLLCGMLGLVVDLGWLYFTRRSAQLAADAGALAAVRMARVNQPTDTMRCGENGLACAAAPVECGAGVSGNLASACLYMANAGFSSGLMHSVTVQASDRTTAPTVLEYCGQGGALVHHPPTAGCVDTHYWVTVTASRRIPQLFSRIMGNDEATAGARATAALADYVASGNLWALNRQFETPVVGRGDTGNDIYVWGDSALVAGGIILSSTSSGGGTFDESGVVGGSGSVTGNTSIRGTGWVNDPSKFFPPPVNGFADLPIFDDPMRGKGQPPAPRGLPEVMVPNGLLTGDCSNPPVYAPGSYFAVNPTTGKATGDPIRFSGCATFSAGAGGFGNYVFFGGLDLGSNRITFMPGRYILAGSKTGTILSLANNAIMQDNTPLDSSGNSVPNTDAGEIFVLTDANYPGLQIPSRVTPIQSSLDFGEIYIQSGNKFEMNLHGLNANHSALPEDLATFAPTVLWQDQRNSPVKYDENGYVDFTSCGSGHSLDDPCPNTDPTITPGLILQASPKLQLYGLIYQPRGAGIEFQGNAHIRAPFQLITGSVSLQGGNTLELTDVANPLRRRIVALVEYARLVEQRRSIETHGCGPHSLNTRWHSGTPAARPAGAPRRLGGGCRLPACAAPRRMRYRPTPPLGSPSRAGNNSGRRSASPRRPVVKSPAVELTCKA